MASTELFENRLYAALEVANVLGVTRQSIYLWRRKGQFPVGVMFGNCRRFAGHELNDWLAARYESTPQPGSKARG